MAIVEAGVGRRKSLKDADLKRKLQELRGTDNFTNFLYIGRIYLVLILSIGGAIAFQQWQLAAGVSFWWNVPVFLLAIFAVGASQHQLAGATHEATHHTLFKNRYLNELVSDWLCMFPLFSSTYHFRLHHLAHHQFINDPDRDPDFAQLKQSGHWLQFPVSAARFLRMLVEHLWIPRLIKYMIVRAKFNSLGQDKNVYYREPSRWSNLPLRAGLLYVVGLLGALYGLAHTGNTWLIVGVPLAMFLVATVFYMVIPGEWFQKRRIRPALSFRYIALGRLAFVTLLFTGLTLLELAVEPSAWLYFLVLWVVPMFTTFSFFMILRQIVQHGNGDRGWLTNTRVFLVNPFIRYAVFPFGMDYHLPHHMFATIPHYRLPKLHEALMEFPEYREKGIVVEGYFFPTSHEHPRNPTVVEVLGPEYAQCDDEVYIDHSVLDTWEVDEKEELVREGDAAREKSLRHRKPR